MYATLEDLTRQLPEDLLIQLTDDVGNGVIDTTVTDTALETAGVVIDGYLGGKYTLPLDPQPVVLTAYAVDIAIYHLFGRRQGPPDHWKDRYKDAIDYLRRVADGKQSLGVGDPEPPAADEAAVSSSDRIFSRETLTGY